PHAADVSDPQAVKELYAWGGSRLPQVDILVNNAGTNVPDRALARVSREDFDQVVRVNLNGVFYLMDAVLPEMRARGAGVVITIASIAGVRSGVVPGAAYSASKHGARALSLSAHLEEGGNGIRCCLIHPGEVDTPIMDRRPNAPSPARRATMLQPEDLAQAVLFVATLHPRANVPEMMITPTVQPYS
ncbi:MAG: SDR family NAD(P)-dependent oxidoreductase, partial [Gammaproteobacteria bacterium]|nr:SDR family NAD(P)-dependent oxidoreductase [Gammaproteobacteria bacterium]